MAKRTVILIITAIILLASVAGGFFWQQKKDAAVKHEQIEEKLREERKMIFASPDDYEVKITAEGTFVEDEKDGFKVKIPEGWNVEKAVDIIEIGGEKVILLSPDFIASRPPTGCMISFNIARNSDLIFRNAAFVNNFIIRAKDDPDGMKDFGSFESYEAVEIAGRPALKGNYFIQPSSGPSIGGRVSIEIPVENKLYSFNALLTIRDKERCEQAFNELLETISIK